VVTLSACAIGTAGKNLPVFTVHTIVYVANTIVCIPGKHFLNKKFEAIDKIHQRMLLWKRHGKGLDGKPLKPFKGLKKDDVYDTAAFERDLETVKGLYDIDEDLFYSNEEMLNILQGKDADPEVK
jgi:hypothetical protein